jgi:hypothetical protein
MYYMGPRILSSYCRRCVRTKPLFWLLTVNKIPLLAPATALNMSAAFSSDAQAIIARPLDLEAQEKRTGIQRKEDDLSISDFYEIVQTAAEIQSRQLKRVINIHPLQIYSVLSELQSADCVAVPR